MKSALGKKKPLELADNVCGRTNGFKLRGNVPNNLEESGSAAAFQPDGWGAGLGYFQDRGW